VAASTRAAACDAHYSLWFFAIAIRRKGFPMIAPIEKLSQTRNIPLDKRKKQPTIGPKVG